ncbi:MAG: GNAT family N-acetyltransferase [Planctomycetota bacterium]
MPEVRLRQAAESDKAIFSGHFQDYLAELAEFSRARPDRRGVFHYDQFDLYWRERRRMPFFIESDGETAGLLLLRELDETESAAGRGSLQVAEIYVFKGHRRRAIARETMRLAARMAVERDLPLTWSAYINNGPANALYRLVLDEFGAKDGAWRTRRTRGIDRGGLARFYYSMAPAAINEKTA